MEKHCGAAGLHARPSAGRPESKMAGAVVLEASQAGQQVARRDIAGRAAGEYDEEGSPRLSRRRRGLPGGGASGGAIVEVACVCELFVCLAER